MYETHPANDVTHIASESYRSQLRHTEVYRQLLRNCLRQDFNSPQAVQELRQNIGSRITGIAPTSCGIYVPFPLWQAAQSTRLLTRPFASMRMVSLCLFMNQLVSVIRCELAE